MTNTGTDVGPRSRRSRTIAATSAGAVERYASGPSQPMDSRNQYVNGTLAIPDQPICFHCGKPGHYSTMCVAPFSERLRDWENNALRERCAAKRAQQQQNVGQFPEGPSRNRPPPWVAVECGYLALTMIQHWVRGLVGVPFEFLPKVYPGVEIRWESQFSKEQPH
ncbi:zinc finger domain-containing protein [Ophiocordyceps sinensis CO18]|uniref:Zinc finger domain-containing protein n=1 Tax=Ophiocordyceps sinensis (strain Co18 / CGMCC 3.14243) TaxID=911162 RepID=T5AEP4_OPHSC|nr:zinc finger domain-containing protein [Ophiocordyceps sinensis CO18]